MTDIQTHVLEKLKEVKDPEFGRSIAERNLIDEVVAEGATVTVRYHLTVPFCPDVFALYIGREIRKKALEVPGVEKVDVILQGHNKAEALTQILQSEG